MAEFCCAELGAVLGVSTAAAKRLMGNALELRHRLPRLWEQVQAGVVPAWRARAVAEAITRHGLEVDPDPAQDPEHGWQQVDPRHATDKGQVHFAGTLRLEAELDLADALDLDRTLTQGAATLKALGSGAGLDARRAMALGDRILTAPVPRPHPNGQLSVRITGWTPRPSPGC